MPGIPDPFSVAVARRTPYRYDDVHDALAYTAHAGIPPELAAEWIGLLGPRAAVRISALIVDVGAEIDRRVFGL